MANTTSLNSALFQDLLKQSEFALYETSIVRGVTTVFDYPTGAGKTVSIPMWDSFAANSAVNEGEAPTVSSVETNSKEITLKEHVWYGQITDMLRDSAAENVISTLASQAGMSIGESLDSDFIALFNSMSGNVNVITQSVGSISNDNTVFDIMKAAATIRANKYNGQLFALVNPLQAWGIKKALTATSNYQVGTMTGSNALAQYYVGNVGGVTILETALVGIDVSGDSVGCVFAPTAFGFAQRGQITLETQREAAKRATDLVLTAVAKSGILRPTLAVRLVGDAVAD